MIAAADELLAVYLREHADIVALGARVAPRVPDSATGQWVRVTLLDATDDPRGGLEYLIDNLVQFDCYASDVKDGATAQASTLARTVRAALKQAQATTVGGVIVSSVRFTGMLRLPDPDFEPARERYVLTASVVVHP